MFEPIKNPFHKHARRINFQNTLDSSLAIYKIKPILQELFPDIYVHIKLVSIKKQTLKIQVEHPAILQRIQEQKPKLLKEYQKLALNIDIKSIQISINYWQGRFFRYYL